MADRQPSKEPPRPEGERSSGDFKRQGSTTPIPPPNVQITGVLPSVDEETDESSSELRDGTTEPTESQKDKSLEAAWEEAWAQRQGSSTPLPSSGRGASGVPGSSLEEVADDLRWSLTGHTGPTVTETEIHEDEEESTDVQGPDVQTGTVEEIRASEIPHTPSLSPRTARRGPSLGDLATPAAPDRPTSTPPSTDRSSRRMSRFQTFRTSSRNPNTVLEYFRMPKKQRDQEDEELSAYLTGPGRYNESMPVGLHERENAKVPPGRSPEPQLLRGAQYKLDWERKRRWELQLKSRQVFRKRVQEKMLARRADKKKQYERASTAKKVRLRIIQYLRKYANDVMDGGRDAREY